MATIQFPSPPQSQRQPSRRSSHAPSRRPSIIRKTPRSSSSPPVVSTLTSVTSLTDEQARQTLETWIELSEWYQKDEIEPVVGAPGVPTCALQLAEKGQSIYCCFLLVAKGRGGKVLGWKSAIDPRSGWDRLHRAIAKERVRRGHRPFKCTGRHEPNWCVHPQYHLSNSNRFHYRFQLVPRPQPGGSQRSSFPQKCLGAVSRVVRALHPQMRACTQFFTSSRPIASKNMQRHLRDMHRP